MAVCITQESCVLSDYVLGRLKSFYECRGEDSKWSSKKTGVDALIEKIDINPFPWPCYVYEFL